MDAGLQSKLFGAEVGTECTGMHRDVESVGRCGGGRVLGPAQRFLNEMPPELEFVVRDRPKWTWALDLFCGSKRLRGGTRNTDEAKPQLPPGAEDPEADAPKLFRADPLAAVALHPGIFFCRVAMGLGWVFGWVVGWVVR